jgi:surface antigen
MLAQGTGVRWCLFGTVLALTLPLGSQIAEARATTHHSGRYSHHSGRSRTHFASSGVIQCVTFARQASGVELKGNARNWWNEADGRYARGNVPEPGSVLSFRASGAIRLGHVAVVHSVVNSREIEIDHAHWARNGVFRGVSVIDVSPTNDWTAVRVAFGRGGEYGSIYPTDGFIYDRAAGAPIQTARVLTVATPVPELNPPPRDLRPRAGRRGRHSPRSTYEELAQMPVGGKLNLSLSGLNLDAPSRSLR